MAVTTYTDQHGSGFLSRLGAWFSKVFQSILASREAEAGRYVATTLRMADDETLTRLGLTREEVNSRPYAPFIY